MLKKLAIKVTMQQLSTIVAALRYYQQDLHEQAPMLDAIHAIADDNGDTVALDPAAIDILIEQINLRYVHDDCNVSYVELAAEAKAEAAKALPSPATICDSWGVLGEVEGSKHEPCGGTFVKHCVECGYPEEDCQCEPDGDGDEHEEDED